MKNNRVQKPKELIELTMWLLVTTFIFVHIFIFYPRPSLYLNKENGIIYDLFSRELFSLSISWIIVYCQKFNFNGLINRVLSHHCWQPFSKMCLSIYLVHYVYMTLTLANQKQSYFVDTWWLLHIFIGDVIICFMLSLIFYLTIESPMTQLANFYIRNNKCTSKRKIRHISQTVV
jgi:hypothetical protein